MNGIVYLISDGTNYKIGWTKSDVKTRISSLQTASAYDLTLEAALSGSVRDEKFAHHRFKHLNLRGEWFVNSPDILDYFQNHLCVLPIEGIMPMKCKERTITSIIADSIGREAMAYSLGVRSTAIITQISSGQFPSSWFDVVERMSLECGIECPRSAFRFKTGAS